MERFTECVTECDYLVVGAGAASLAFVDTLLTELPETKIVLIDKKHSPGGHWVDAYGFVRLHQPSRFYGIASSPLESESKSESESESKPESQLPLDPPEHEPHRATKPEILAYFRNFVDTGVASGRVEFYPGCMYEFDATTKPFSSGGNCDGEEETDHENLHFFRNVDGSESYCVKVNIKLIDGTKGECIIPHDSPLPFPVDEGVTVVTPNQLYDTPPNTHKHKNYKYVVLGAGKTGIDCVVYLQRSLKVHPSDIAWVISRDVWMGNSGYRGNDSDPQTWARCLAKSHGDTDASALALESKGMLVRLDSSVLPSRFRFPVIPPDELELARNITTILRRGRVASIRRRPITGGDIDTETETDTDTNTRGDTYTGGSKVVLGFEDSGRPSWEAFAPIESCVFVHASSPGPFNGLDPDLPVFDSPQKMTLQLLLTGPRTFSMSLLAKLEAGRRKKTLDLDCLRRLVDGYEGSTEHKNENKNKNEDKNRNEDENENEILRAAIRPLTQASPYRPLMNLAIVLAILDNDPLAAIDWMKHNRLCFLSVAGTKASSCEDIRMLRAEARSLGLPESDRSMLQVLGDKLRPLEGL